MFLTAFLTSITCVAAITADGVDYEAARTLRKNLSNKVKNETLSPVWKPDGSALFYQFENTIWEINAVTGEKREAIVPSALARFFKGETPRIPQFTITEDGDFVCWQNLKDAGFPDRIAGIKAAAKKYPYMDITRVGIYGGSAGGQNAMRAVGMLDSNVDPSSTMQVVDALIKANKDFELYADPNGGHCVIDSPYGQHKQSAFFVRHLRSEKE